ncbi:extracellular solute-binding protein [Halorussus gelatinilyticus]|uniref:Extracellular solute-binding protein n=1 Tax=Halorussus gelatinilyticus TaxID=2937524 RepID=A0A8U0II30_9EURY|nr:extracellular solute-binding protein [Halorussus gelatinilyticus]UPW00346.1 extracellular solute-binding protein [Halorussus gelatinilyticus]
MVDSSSHESDGRDGSVSRRNFVRAVGASGAAAGLAGCVGGGDPEQTDTSGTIGNVDNQGQKTTLQWATDPDFQGATWNKELQPILYNNGLSKDIEVNVLAGPSVTDNRRAQYQQWLAAGRNKPDLLYMDSGWTIPFIVRNQLLNLSQAGNFGQEYMQQLENEYFEASVSTAKGPNGDLFAVPMFPDFPTMQYNKKYLQNAGFGQSDFDTWATDSMTWQKFSQVTNQALQNNDLQYGYTFQANAYEGLSCCDFNEFMSSWGGAYFGNPEKYLFGPVGDRPITVNEPQVVNAIKMVRTFIHGSNAKNTLSRYQGNIAPPAVMQWTEEPSRKPFTNGDAAMHRNWPYAINISGSEDNLGKDLGVMPIPYAKTKQEAKYPMTGGPVAALGGWHNAVNPNSKNPEAAIEVLKAMMSDEFKYKLFEVLGFLPPEPKLLTSQRAKEVPVMGRYLEPLRVAGENAIPRPVTPVWPAESAKIAQQVNGAFSKGGNPSKAMTQLQAQLEAIESSA